MQTLNDLVERGEFLRYIGASIGGFGPLGTGMDVAALDEEKRGAYGDGVRHDGYQHAGGLILCGIDGRKKETD